MLSWEIHLRNQGNKISYDDNEALWSDKRAMVYQAIDKATVFAGSSRIKYDLDIPTWVSTYRASRRYNLPTLEAIRDWF